MSPIDIFYLSLVLVAFFGFAAALAYFTQRDRLPKGYPAQALSQQRPAKESAAKPARMHEHA
jgi:hypothetical protein